MPQNFISFDREQQLLLPPNLKDWLPGDHLGWFMLDTVEAMDLSGFYRAYRADGHGRAAHEPAMTSRCCCARMRRGSDLRVGIEPACQPPPHPTGDDPH